MMLKKSIYLLLLTLLCANTFGQIQTSYYYDFNANKTIETITEEDFISFEDKVNEGLNNGVYWVKIETDEATNVIEIPAAHISKIKCFQNKKEILKIENSVIPAFKVGSNQTIYLKVECKKEAYIPIKSHAETEYSKSIRIHFFVDGLYYGFAIMVIIINLFYYFNFRDRTFLYYSLVLIVITFALFYRDSLITLLSDNQFVVNDMEVIIHLGIGILGALFAADYLQHKIYFPKLKYLFIALNIVLVLSFTLYLIFGAFEWLVVGEVMTASVLIGCWISSLFLFRKNAFSKFFTIGYALLLFFAFDFFINPLLGIANIGLTTDFLKIGGVLEMLILSYAVVYRMKTLQLKNEEIRNALFQHVTQIEALEDELLKLQSGKENTITKANLSAREIEILTFVSEGKTNKEIADELCLTIHTIKYHTRNLYDKLKVTSRQEALIKAFENQILPV